MKKMMACVKEIKISEKMKRRWAVANHEKVLKSVCFGIHADRQEHYHQENSSTIPLPAEFFH